MDNHKEVEPMDLTNTCAGVAPPTLGSRITRWLFPRRHLLPLTEMEEALQEGLGFAPGELSIDTHIRLGWPDRLRTLISGKLAVPHRCATDKLVERIRTRSTVYVKAPWESW